MVLYCTVFDIFDI